MITRRLHRPLSTLTSSNWIWPSCTRTTLFRQPPQQRRAKHDVPALNFDQTFSKHGIPGLISKEGYEIAWTIYQNLLVTKLNDLVEGPDENAPTKNLVVQYARDPLNAALFNHASMAFNNHFFFQGLSTSPQELHKCPNLKDSLENSFGSIDTLRTTMLDTATAMFGPGFVWLVWAKDPMAAASGGSFKILNTYIAGTPFPEAGYRRKDKDMATNNAGAFGPSSEAHKGIAKYPPGSTDVIPVLCVNTWEHVWLYDYGIQGKREYLSRWWEAIDWYRVENNLPQTVKQPARFESNAETFSGRY